MKSAQPLEQTQEVHTVEADTMGLYAKHCASCHGSDRLGGSGPALLPQNLRRLRPKAAIEVVSKGRMQTQMPGFDHLLSEDEIKTVVDYIYQKPPEMPQWPLESIRQSHKIHHRLELLNPKPVFDADPLNLFTVVEAGNHHVSILDGDKFEVLHRFASRFALHGGAKYSPRGRFVYLASRDGWVSKFDLYNLKMVAEVRAGINTRNIAVSADGKFVMVANYLPHTLVLLDADYLAPIKIIDIKNDRGQTSRVSAVYVAPPRNSFIAALKDLPEVWEIYYDKPPPGFSPHLVHDYRKDSGEGEIEPAKPFQVRRILLDDYLDDFFFDQAYEHLIGAAREGKKGQVVNLTVGRRIAKLDLTGMPHLGSGISWNYRGRPILMTPNLKESVISVIDMQSWQTTHRLASLGPGFFARSHENSRYAWVDVFFGPHRDVVHVIDKQSLKIVKNLKPAPGKVAGHVEFTRDGRYALLSIWENDGALIVYDASTLKEIKRIGMNKPSGKYNVYNKIHRSSGTSH